MADIIDGNKWEEIIVLQETNFQISCPPKLYHQSFL